MRAKLTTFVLAVLALSLTACTDRAAGLMPSLAAQRPAYGASALSAQPVRQARGVHPNDLIGGPPGAATPIRGPISTPIGEPDP